MNKRGFTITELLAVVVILGILAALASVGVSRYRQHVREKELINLHSTIETGFDNYRSRAILNGETVPMKLDLCETATLPFDITYNGNRLKCDGDKSDIKIKTAEVYTKIKGDLLVSGTDAGDKYKNAGRTTEEHYKEDGTCMIESSKEKNETTREEELVKNCAKDASSDNIVPSNEEIICIKLVIESEGTPLIDDFSDENSMCRYWKESE